MKHLYPAIFTKEEEGGYSVHFPDLQGCYSQGDDVNDAYEMSQDALALWLAHAEDKGLDIPAPSSVDVLHPAADETIALIACDTDVYHRMWGSKAVKKTLTIPAWLNTKVEAANVNFSPVLQEALKNQLLT